MAKLTDRQQRFVDAWLLDPNATEAARKAGYKKPRQEGSRLLSNAVIAAAIRSAQDARSKRNDIDADWVLRGLKAEAELQGEGSSHSARVSAYKAVGQHLGMFVERLKVEGGVTVEVQEIVVRTRAEAAAALAAVAEAS